MHGLKMETIEAKVLVLTLCSGENELSACKKSVKAQGYPNVEHFFIANLPNKEAHDALYSEIMSNCERFDIFIKLDADMVLEDPSFIDNVVRAFINDKNLDMLSFTVFDFLTNSRIWGLIVFLIGATGVSTPKKYLLITSPHLLEIKTNIRL